MGQSCEHLREQEEAVSDHPRDDDELQALLAGTSALSRRYSELSDEQPPAHLDASILAASRSALEPEKHRSGLRRSGSIWSSIWSRFSLMQWSVPIATAAVVIVAATLTLTIQRDPEIDRLYDKYDKPSPVVRERSETSSADKAEIEKSSANKLEIATSGTLARESVIASPKLAAPPSASAPRRVPASPPTRAKQKASQKDEQRSNAARKRSDQSRLELAAGRSGERDAAASARANIEANVAGDQKVSGEQKITSEQKVIGEQKIADERGVVGKEQIVGQAQFLVEEQVADAPKPPQAFPDSDDALAVNEPADVAAASAELSNDEFAIAGAPTPSASLDSIEAEELMKSTIERSPGRQQASTRLAESEPVVMQRFADEDSPARLAKAEAIRDPGDWIEDIEKLLADGKRDEAIASLEKFRLDYPDYQLPENLKSLVRTQTE